MQMQNQSQKHIDSSESDPEQSVALAVTVENVILPPIWRKAVPLYGRSKSFPICLQIQQVCLSLD